MSYYNNRGMGRGRGGGGFNNFRSSFGGDRGGNRTGGRGGGGYNPRGGYGSRGRGGRGGPGARFGGSGSTHSSFNDSRSSDRYSGGGGGNRYDDYKPYRSENSGFSGRDRSPDRKRFREDALKASQPHNGLFVQAPSSRRSNDGGYGAGGGNDSFNSSRSFDSSYTERRGFSRGDRRQYQMPTQRDDFRKPGGFLPSRGPPQSHRSPRGGGFRGRISTRGSRPPMRFRELPHMASSRGRRLNENSYAVQRRVRITRIADMRRRKISLIRSKALAHAKKDLGIADDDKKAEDDEEEKDDEDMKDDDEVEDHGEEEEEADAEGDGEAKKKSPKKEAKEGDADKAESGGEEALRHREFIKLVCPHCHSYCLTFNKYILHLRGGRHAQAMRKVALKQKAILNRLRQSQRNAQRDLEKNADGLSSHSNFCPLCKLNYKTPKNVHQASDSHKSMKKFLMPFCKVCKRTCKSPMMYENHVCSLEHIKRKARQTTVNGDKSDQEEEEEEEEGSGNEENFMTIDSVGDVDDGEGKDAVVKKEKEGDEDDKSSLPTVNIGIEQIRKVEVHYCDLCRIYLARGDEAATDRIIARHCKMLTHMQRYIRYKEDKEIELRAQKLQHKEAAEKKAKVEALENALKKDPATDGEKKTEDEETVDDKLWADVDKDLGDILAEAETGNKSSDEEEEKTGERYDRFGSIKKNEEVKEAGDVAVKEEKSGDAEVVAAAN